MVGGLEGGGGEALHIVVQIKGGSIRLFDLGVLVVEVGVGDSY